MNSLCSTKDKNSDEDKNINLGKANPLVTSLTYLAFPNLQSTTHDCHIDDATNDKYVNPTNPSNTARKVCLPDLSSISDEDSGDITG